MAKKLNKAKVQVTLTFEEYLRKFFGMWYDDAEVLAKLLGMDEPKEEYDPDEWIEGQLENVQLIKSMYETKDYSKFAEVAMSDIELIKSAVNNYGEVKKSLSSKMIDFIEKHFKGTNRETPVEKQSEKEALPIIKSVDELKREVTFVLYAPDEVDSQGDYTTADVLEKACGEFNEALNKGSIVPNLFHLKDADGKYQKTETFQILKTYIVPEDCYYENSEAIVKAGTWVCKVKFVDDILWNAFLEGDVKGLSIGCYGVYGEE